MKKKIGIIIYLILLLSTANCLGNKSKSGESKPQTTSEASKDAQKSAQKAEKKAAEAQKHSEKAQTAKSEAKAKSEAAKSAKSSAEAAAASAEAQQKAAEAKAAQAKGTADEKKYAAEAEKAKQNAEKAKNDAAQAAKEAEASLERFKQAEKDCKTAEDAENDANEDWKAAQDALAEALAADEAFQDAYELYKEKCDSLNDCVDQLTFLLSEKNKNKDIAENQEKVKSLKQEIDKKEKELKIYQDTACYYADKMKEAYENLGPYKEVLQQAGDPVIIATGDFVANYADFIAQDYLDAFSIERTLRNDNIAESFGVNWTCPLDSRIVRCNYESYEDCKIILALMRIILVKMKSLFDDYNSKYPNYPRSETDSYLAEINQLTTENDQDIQEFLDVENTRNELLDLNKYVTYGKYEKLDSYFGFKKQLKYLDSDGREYTFNYDSNGVWKSFGKLSAAKLKIFGLKEDGTKSTTEETPGGYIVEYTNGRKRQFNKYGILVCDFDSNGNIVKYENYNGRINKIILKTGEELSVYRNTDNLISKISGPISGTVSYQYQEKKLISVTDNFGKVINFNYNNENNLTQIIKADGKSVNLQYEYNSALKKNVCNRVINENGYSEYFNLDYPNKTMIHTTYDGKNEIYKFDEYGNTVYLKDKNENITQIETNENELVKKFTKNNAYKTFEYDDNFRIKKCYLENGGTVLYDYNQFGQITKITDADGFTRSYNFDNKGNLTSECFCNLIVNEYSYYSNGLLKSISNQNEIIEIKYNQYGSVTEEKITSKDGTTRTVFAEYNQQNKLIKYTDEKGYVTEVNYLPGKIIETTQKKKTERYFDSRNREYLIVVTDLINGVSHSKKQIFDGIGNIIQIYLDDKLYSEYKYSADSVLLEEKKHAISNDDVDEISVISNVYNNHGYLETQIETLNNKKYYRKENNINFQNDKMTIQTKCQNDFWTTYEYNKNEQLIKEKYADGYTLNYVYSKGGRIQSITDNKMNQWKYTYHNDGSFQINLVLKSGITCLWKYNSSGRLVYKKNFANDESYITYDSNGNVINQKNPLYEIVNKYDEYNRKIYTKTVDKSGKKYFEYVISFDDTKSIAKVYCENEIYEELKFDSFGNVLEIKDANGIHYYKTDVLGRCIKCMDSCGNEIQYFYDTHNNVRKVINPDGSIYSYFYNPFGNIENVFLNDKLYYSMQKQDDNSIVVKDYFGTENKFFYNQQGKITSFNSSKTGKKNVSELTEFDDFGNITKEVNDNKILRYEYDLRNNLKSVYKNDNLICEKKYTDNNVETIYNDGTKTEIFRNCIGLITKIKTDNAVIEYEYDNYGRITRSFDSVSNVYVDYSYDNFGRCVEKKSSQFDMKFTYDNCGRLEKLNENKSGCWIKLSYDSMNREINREFWNGVSTSTKYNLQGQIESRVSKNVINQIIAADFILRDENGRVSVVCNENGDYEKYSYNEKGHLVHSIIPCNDNIVSFYQKEFNACGLPFLVENNLETETKLTNNEIQNLQKIIENSELGKNIPISNYQKSWIDEYEYTDAGSISSVKNKLGKIIYEYDNQNRLQKKYIDNFPENPMVFLWNDDGNLINVKSNNLIVNIEYNSMNKPICLEEKQYSKNSENRIYYNYDALGRRVHESDNINSYVYVYDKTSLSVMGKFVTQTDFTVNEFYSNKVNDVQGKYRWIDDTDYVPYGKAKTIVRSNENIDIKNNDNRAYFVMNLFMEPLVNIYLDSNHVTGNDGQSLVLNYKSNCVAVCDSNSNCVSRNCYDIWGNCIAFEKNPVFNYSLDYSGTTFQLYNLGERDYSPFMKSFITEDMARDGGNWYAYCCTDPVNYFDYQGNTIIPVEQTFLMTDDDLNGITRDKEGKIIDNKPVYLGNQSEYLFKDHGCYVVSFANILYELQQLGYNTGDLSYDNPFGINNNKDFFSEGTDNIYIDKLMESTVGTENYEDYSYLQGVPKITEALLAKAENSIDDYTLAAVFDLSEANSLVPNHMVVLNDEAESDGVFEQEDVVGSSKNDKSRLNDTPDAYRTENIKRLLLIKGEKSNNGCTQ